MLRVNGKDAPERSGAATHFDSVGNAALERLLPRINVEEFQQASLSPGQADQVSNQRPKWQGFVGRLGLLACRPRSMSMIAQIFVCDVT